MQHADWSYGAVLYEMNVRQLTEEGTFIAAMRHLQHLKDMGVDAVWLMPIYPIGKVERKGSLGSYYSISDYCAVNPEFGSMTDFDAFVAEAHRLGMKVILDWVANHTARDAKWLKDKPMNWYERDEQGAAKVPWDWSDTAKLNYAEKAVWQGQIDAMKFWVQEHAVDGFRCDMAMLVPLEFWQEVRRELQCVKSDILCLPKLRGRNSSIVPSMLAMVGNCTTRWSMLRRASRAFGLFAIRYIRCSMIIRQPQCTCRLRRTTTKIRGVTANIIALVLRSRR